MLLSVNTKELQVTFQPGYCDPAWSLELWARINRLISIVPIIAVEILCKIP